MIATLITSTVLIVLIVALRFFLRGKIALRLQYALWALVLLRLLIPFSLPESSISVMNAAPAAAVERAVFEEKKTDSGAAEKTEYLKNNGLSMRDEHGNDEIQAAPQNALSMSWRAVLKTIWLGGAATAGTWFLVANIAFWLDIKKARVRLEHECELLVYVVESLASPCLFGIIHPAIYITENAANDEKILRHVLTHELSHYHHCDNIILLLRDFCLALYWFDPFVWIAAALSRRDCELACDEAAIASLGESERIDYGRTLVNMIAREDSPASFFCTATTMTGSEKGIKERITLIAKKPKTLVWTLISVLIIVALTVGCTFTGAKSNPLKENESKAEKPVISESEKAESSKPDRSEDTAAFDLRDKDDAIRRALLDYSRSYSPFEEYAIASYVTLDSLEEQGEYTAYVWSHCFRFGFENEVFTVLAGSSIPAKLVFSLNEKGEYICEKLEYPKNGSEYDKSLREIFTATAYEKSKDYESFVGELTKQETQQAEEYLKRIGRSARVEVQNANIKKELPDMNAQAANNFFNTFSDYPEWIGRRECIEDGLRYVYEKTWESAGNGDGKVEFIKYVFDTKALIEKYVYEIKGGVVTETEVYPTEADGAVIKIETSSDTLPFKTNYTFDYSRDIGYSLVTQEGADGSQNYTESVKYMNGKELSREKVKVEIMPESVDCEITIGTKLPEGFTLIWPTDNNYVSAGFWDFYGHKGADIPGDMDANIYAAAAGTVIAAEWTGAYGNYVVIDHGGGKIKTVYGHMSSIEVKADDKVDAGDVIGHMGKTGNATGVMLHFEVQLEDISVDPLPYYGNK